MPKVMIYSTSDGQIELDVSLVAETVWLSLNQLAQLFGRDKSAISKHLTNIFKNNELDRDSVVAKIATTASDGKTYQVDHYNLDAIISLGYRVNSQEGIRFRQWATHVIKEHLIKGYTLREKRLADKGVKELQLSIDLIQRMLTRNNLVSDIGVEAIQLIMSYTKTWQLLLAYDEDDLKLPLKGNKPIADLEYEMATKAISALKSDLMTRKEASALFGLERDEKLKDILKNIEQTFDKNPLYKIIEERAAHLLYFIIKDHPFTDGNKRIGCLIFLLYLKLQGMLIKINDNGLVALALLIAESHPMQKDLMIRLIVNLLID